MAKSGGGGGRSGSGNTVSRQTDEQRGITRDNFGNRILLTDTEKQKISKLQKQKENNNKKLNQLNQQYDATPTRAISDEIRSLRKNNKKIDGEIDSINYLGALRVREQERSAPR